MALSQPLYVFSLETQKEHPNQDGSFPEVLLLSPVLFKTVFDAREQVVWGLRKTVLKLKLYDLIAFQQKEWEIQGLNPNDFFTGCRNIIPLAHIDQRVLELFGLQMDDEETDSLVSQHFEKYSQKVVEYEESVQDALTKLEMEKQVPNSQNDAGDNNMLQEPLQSRGNQIMAITQESPMKPIQLCSQPVDLGGPRSRSSGERHVISSQPNTKGEMFTFLGKHSLDEELELPACFSKIPRIGEPSKLESMRSSQTNSSNGFSSSLRKEFQDALAENMFLREVHSKARELHLKEHKDLRSRVMAERVYHFLRGERRSRMNLGDLCTKVTKNQPEMMTKSKQMTDLDEAQDLIKHYCTSYPEFGTITSINPNRQKTIHYFSLGDQNPSVDGKAVIPQTI